MLNRYLIPELLEAAPFGHRGMFDDDVEIALNVLDRMLPIVVEDRLFDREYDKRVELAFENWQLTLNF